MAQILPLAAAILQTQTWSSQVKVRVTQTLENQIKKIIQWQIFLWASQPSWLRLTKYVHFVVPKMDSLCVRIAAKQWSMLMLAADTSISTIRVKLHGSALCHWANVQTCCPQNNFNHFTGLKIIVEDLLTESSFKMDSSALNVALLFYQRKLLGGTLVIAENLIQM